jgi:hypothetical protein
VEELNEGFCCPKCRESRRRCSSLQEVNALNEALLLAMRVACPPWRGECHQRRISLFKRTWNHTDKVNRRVPALSIRFFGGISTTGRRLPIVRGESQAYSPYCKPGVPVEKPWIFFACVNRSRAVDFGQFFVDANQRQPHPLHPRGRRRQKRPTRYQSDFSLLIGI